VSLNSAMMPYVAGAADAALAASDLRLNMQTSH
jgi:hypothetical protein